LGCQPSRRDGAVGRERDSPHMSIRHVEARI
jgi:hypothetical protein